MPCSAVAGDQDVRGQAGLIPRRRVTRARPDARHARRGRPPIRCGDRSHQAPLVAHRQCQQVDVRDLSMAEHEAPFEHAQAQKAQVIRPEDVRFAGNGFPLPGFGSQARPSGLSSAAMARRHPLPWSVQWRGFAAPTAWSRAARPGVHRRQPGGEAGRGQNLPIRQVLARGIKRSTAGSSPSSSESTPCWAISRPRCPARSTR